MKSCKLCGKVPKISEYIADGIRASTTASVSCNCGVKIEESMIGKKGSGNNGWEIQRDAFDQALEEAIFKWNQLN